MLSRYGGLVAPLLALVVAACAKPKPEAAHVPMPSPRKPVAELVAALSASDPEARRQAAWALAGAGRVDDKAIASLEPLLHDQAQGVRYAAAWALGHIGRHRYYDVEPVPTPMRPQYPAEAFRRHITGTVTLEVLIGEAGEVAHAEVRESIPELDAAAVDCVHQWKFRPAVRQGNPIAVMAAVR